ncbi:BAG6 family protein [Megaselia abdita]
MIIQLKVKTLDSRLYNFQVDDETTILQFKDMISEKTNIASNMQRIIYCGRVLLDEKQLKEYDVNGKVVHVVERLPPSTGLGAPSTTNTNTNTTSGQRRDNNPPPFLRTLDGMVVGSFTIPLNGNAQPNQQAMSHLTPSTSFCMNRITVARHMLNCANNIAAYLEDPERGLNNTSLDILSQGRWTMESTVVEVGITADVGDIGQNQSIAEALEGIFTNALRGQNVQNANVTLVELPVPIPAESANSNEPNTSLEEPSTTTQADGEESSSSSTAAVAGSEEGASNTNEGANDEPVAEEEQQETPSEGQRPRQRTRTQVLARVVEQMRNVQSRLGPFIDQYYDILISDPNFHENDTTGREQKQRIYDRVSEALHYLSHAQHAISDLMLDLTQQGPRYLTCRPILVEQSGFVSTNNYLAAFPSNGNTPTVNTPNNPHANINESNAQNQPSNSSNENATADNSNLSRFITNVLSNAVSGINGSDVQVDVASPNVITIGVPVNASQPPQEPRESSNTLSGSGARLSDLFNLNMGRANNEASQQAPTTEAPATNNPRVVTIRRSRQPVTNPTTSTNTMSTSRPHVRVGTPFGFHPRMMPQGMVSSFDRFLPCSSHHIRESERAAQSDPSGVVLGPEFTRRAFPRVSRFRSLPRNLARRSTPLNAESTRSEVSSQTISAASTCEQFRRLVELHLFSGLEISDQYMTRAIELLFFWIEDALLFLPQYGLPNIDARASIEAFLKHKVPILLNTLRREDPRSFIDSFMNAICQLKKLLFECIGTYNTTLFWDQIDRTLFGNFSENNENRELVQFQRAIMRHTYNESQIRNANISKFIIKKTKETPVDGNKPSTSLQVSRVIVYVLIDPYKIVSVLPNLLKWMWGWVRIIAIIICMVLNIS